MPRPLMKASKTDRMLLERVQEENFHLDVFGKLRAPSLVMDKILKALKGEKDLDQGENPFMSRVDSKNRPGSPKNGHPRLSQPSTASAAA